MLNSLPLARTAASRFGRISDVASVLILCILVVFGPIVALAVAAHVAGDPPAAVAGPVHATGGRAG